MRVRSEWVDLTVDDGTAMRAWVARPEGVEPRRGLLVFQEAFGVNAHICEVTERFPYRDEQGEIIGVLGIFEDITDRKRAEEELRHHNDEIQLQRLRVFKATMRTVQDIVNNLLNGLQLVHLEAEAAPPAEMQTLVGQVIQDAAVKLKSLGDLETIKEKEMDIGLGIDYPGATS